jgi:N-acylneuraminate cytidylyltransferase
MEILGFIPARGGSKRLPRKNIKEFLGEPVISYPIRYLKQLGIKPVVSTEDVEIAEVCARFGAEIEWRPPHLADDKTTTTEVLLNFLEKNNLKPEYSLMLHATAVFAMPSKIVEAMNQIKEGNGVFPMVQYGYPPQRGVEIENGLIKMVDESSYYHNTQEFAPLYHDVGQFYLLKTDDLLKERRLFLSRSVPMIVKESESQDVDNEEDWKIAEMKYEIMMGSKGKERR